MLLRYSAPGTATSSVVSGIIEIVFGEQVSIADVTYGSGGFWNDSRDSRRVKRYDLDPARAPDGVQDFRALDLADQSHDIVTFDPPHIADGGVRGIMAARYGTYRNHDLEAAVRQGCREVRRVARVGAIVKVTDAVHGGRFVRMSGWVIGELGEPHDVAHVIRKRSLRDPKWGPQQHAYNNGSTFLVYRWGRV